MIVFLRRIPADTNKNEITTFITPALKGGLFSKSGHISDIKILTLRDNRLNKVEHHGLVRIEPDSVAERVIKKLNLNPINGKNIVVREYILRNWHNDPRLRRNHADTAFPNRRKADRRRHQLEVVHNEERRVSGGFDNPSYRL